MNPESTTLPKEKNYMKNVRLVNNVVYEVLPPEAAPIENWYNKEFAAQCVEAPDEVDQYWVYNPSENKFYAPGEEVPRNGTVENLLDAIIE